MTRAAPFLLLLAVAGTGSAQDPTADEKPIHLPPNGTQLFRALLDFRGVKPSTDPGLVNKIIVIHGKPDPADEAKLQLLTQSVLRQGGAALFLSDKRIGLCVQSNRTGFYLPVGVTSTNTPAEVTSATVLSAQKNYRGHGDCPLVHENSTAEFGRIPGMRRPTGENNPFTGLRAVATNKPGVLLLAPGNPPETRYARFYNEADYRNVFRLESEADYEVLFAAGQVNPSGLPSRWLAMADEDVLSNSLLASQGTDNFVLAFRLVDWLKGPEERTECLFFEYGKLQSKFDEVKFVTLPDLPGPPIPPIPPLKVISQQLTEFGDRFSDELQSHDRLHNHLVGGDRGYARWLLVLSVLAAGVAFVYLVRRMFAGRQPAPGPALWAHDDGTPGKLLAVLRQEMVRGNNFTAAVTAYIDETFRLAGLPPVGPYPEAPLPVAITGRKVKKVELYKDIAALWAVWRTPPDSPIHYAVWRTLEPAAEHVRRLAVKGRWHFAPEFAPPGDAA